MREKSIFLKHLNARGIKTATFSLLCHVPAMRRYLNYYEAAVCFEDAAVPGSIRTLEIHPAKDYGIAYSDTERRDFVRRNGEDPADMRVVFKMAHIQDVSILGSSGVTVGNRTGKVLHLDRNRHRMHPNWVIAQPLRAVAGDDSVSYINLLGVRRGHRHFAHFFWDALIPLMVYLTRWHNPTDKVVVLVREDLSAIQRDAFRFIAEDFAGVEFTTLPANRKLICRDSIYIAFQNKVHGRDNILAREFVMAVRDLFARHYGIKTPPAAQRKRIYVQRGNVALRRITNEREILGILVRHGFEAHDPGSMKFADQAALFATADVVVSAHGSGLTNLMFSPPGTKVLEIFPANFIDDSFMNLSKAMSLSYRHMLAGPGNWRQDFAVNPEMLERALVAMAPVSAGRCPS